MKLEEKKRAWYDEQMRSLTKERKMSKTDIAGALGMVPQALNNIESGSRGLSDKFLDKFADTFGLNLFDLSGVADHAQQGGIPLIPNEAFAGYGSPQFSDIPIEDFYQIKEFDNANFLLRVSGDSMSPKFKSGDLIACRKLEEVTFWQWHRIYAICTRNQGIILKRIEKCDKPDSITCASENPVYAPFDIHQTEILSVALVLGGVVME